MILGDGSSTSNENGLFLGRFIVELGEHSARIQPVARLRDGCWEGLQDVEREFPPEGKAFAPHLIRRQEDDYWVFRSEPNQQSGKDRCLVLDPAAAIPIIDATDLEFEPARQMLFTYGVPLPRGRREMRTAVVALKGGLFCSLQFELSDAGVWKAVPPRDRVELRKGAARWATGFTLEGFHYLPGRSIPVAPIEQTLDWCDEGAFVESVLRRIRKFGLDLAEAKFAVPAKESIQYIARALRGAEILPGDLADPESDLERIRAQWPLLAERFAAAEALRDVILESAVGKEVLKAEADRVRAEETERLGREIRAAVEAEVRVTLESTIRRRDEIEREMEALRRREEELRGIVEGLTLEGERAKALRDGYIGEVEAALSELRRALESAGPGESAYARAFAERMERRLAIAGSAIDLMATAAPPWSLAVAGNEALEASREDLGTRLAAGAKAFGVDAGDLGIVDQFARGGEIVLLTGPRAESTLAAYAASVGGGELRTMVLDPSVIGLDDLWRVAGNSTPTPFANAWTAAVARPNYAVLVCLRNLDSSPFQLWLSALYRVLRSRTRPPNLLVIAMTSGVLENRANEHPLREQLRRWLVALRPGVHGDGALSVMVSLLESGYSNTVLRDGFGIPANWNPPSELFSLLPDSGTDPEIVERALRLAAVAENPARLPDLIEPWLRFVAKGSVEGLPKCLRDGDQDTRQLEFQR